MDLKEKFQDIIFEPVEHTYTVKGQRLMPVSNTIKPYYEEFNAEQKAIEYAHRHGGDPVEIAAGWKNYGKERADFGTSVHDFGERLFHDNTLRPSNGHEEAIVSFLEDTPFHYTPIHSELQMYSERLGIAGTADNLFYDIKTNTIVISDYKTNKDLYKNFRGKKMYEPFEFMLDMPLSHYELQLSTYQVLLEEIGMRISERWIIWLLPDGSYKKILGRDFSVQIEQQLLNRIAC